MADRDETLRWLILQAKSEVPEEAPDHHFTLQGFSLLSPEQVKDKAYGGLQAGEAAMTENLSWGLSEAALSRWTDPSFPELRELNNFERANVLRLAVEMAETAGLDGSVWLALAAHDFCSNAVHSNLGVIDLPELIEKLESRSPQSLPLTNVTKTLACLDSMLSIVSDDRREVAVLAALAAVVSWMHFTPASASIRGASTDGLSEIATMAEWVANRANEVMKSQSVSVALCQRAYSGTCAAAHTSSLKSLKQGLTDAEGALSMFNDLLKTIPVPSVGNSKELKDPQEIADEYRDFLVAETAEWLVERGLSSKALHFLSAARSKDPKESFYAGPDASVAFSRATAYAGLGLIGLAKIEIDNIHPGADPSFWWGIGRFRCENGDKAGIPLLRHALELPELLDFRPARDRMRLLLAEKEIEENHPERALVLTEDFESGGNPATSVHAEVIVAEALLAIGRDDPAGQRDHLNRAKEILKVLCERAFPDTLDRIRPRVLAAMGEVEFLRKGPLSARRWFREAMDALDRSVPASMDGSGFLVPGNTYSDVVSRSYWRRPWNRNWTRVAELGLIVELLSMQDPPTKLEIESAFDQLQRYRVISHARTIAELAGFAPEMSLGASRHKRLEQLRSQAGQEEAGFNSLREEYWRINESLESGAAGPSEQIRLIQRIQEITEQFEESGEDLLSARQEIRQIEREAETTRGYLATTTGIRRPAVSEVKRILDRAGAAVVELVRLNGRTSGLPTNWYAFVATGDGVDLYQLPCDELDHELNLLRGRRTRMESATLQKLSDLIIGRLPGRVFRYENLYFAADGDAWSIPFRSLLRPRWWFVPWKLADPDSYARLPLPKWTSRFVELLAPRVDIGVVSNVTSTSHLVRLLLRYEQKWGGEGVVVGSSGGSKDRILCQGLATSLEFHPIGDAERIRWATYSGSIDACTAPESDRPEWLNGTSGVFMGSWHTTFTGDPLTVALFHFDDGEMTLAEFLSQSRRTSNIAVVLSCNMSRTVDSDTRTFAMMGSAGFGVMEALRASAIVATTNEVTSDVAFLLGRFLTAELAAGCNVHSALKRSQQKLREWRVADVIRLLEGFESDVPETSDWLKDLRYRNPESLAFPNPRDTEPFYILGLPTARWNAEE